MHFKIKEIIKVVPYVLLTLLPLLLLFQTFRAVNEQKIARIFVMTSEGDDLALSSN
jgi:hypothetical protein